MECKVCLEDYDAERRPRNLPCGHTFCSLCLDGLISLGSLSCPTCRRKHYGMDATFFQINYALEELLSQMKIGSESAEDVSETLASLREEQGGGIASTTSQCDDLLSQLDLYKGKLDEWDADHQRLIDKIKKDLVDQNEEMRKNLREERRSVEDLQDQGVQQQQQLKLAKTLLDGAQTAQDVFLAINQADLCQAATQEWIQACQGRLPAVSAVHRSFRVRTATKRALDVMIHKADGGVTPIQLADGAVSSTHSADDACILHKVYQIMKTSTLDLTVQKLLRLDVRAKALLEAGAAFAVCEDVGRLRSAKITLLRNSVYLHHLEDAPPPSYAHTLRHKDVAGLAGSSSTLVFLELAWPGAAPKRVHIRVNSDTARGSRFVRMCLGERGPSYANTPVEVEGQWEAGEVVWGGCPAGQAGGGPEETAAVTPDLPQDAEYIPPTATGDVFGLDSAGVRFGIVTAEEPGDSFGHVFGHVESGLEVVKAAAGQAHTGGVRLVNCGVVVLEGRAKWRGFRLGNFRLRTKRRSYFRRRLRKWMRQSVSSRVDRLWDQGL